MRDSGPLLRDSRFYFKKVDGSHELCMLTTINNSDMKGQQQSLKSWMIVQGTFLIPFLVLRELRMIDSLQYILNEVVLQIKGKPLPALYQ